MHNLSNKVTVSFVCRSHSEQADLWDSVCSHSQCCCPGKLGTISKTDCLAEKNYELGKPHSPVNNSFMASQEHVAQRQASLHSALKKCLHTLFSGRNANDAHSDSLHSVSCIPELVCYIGMLCHVAMNRNIQSTTVFCWSLSNMFTFQTEWPH